LKQAGRQAAKGINASCGSVSTAANQAGLSLSPREVAEISSHRSLAALERYTKIVVGLILSCPLVVENDHRRDSEKTVIGAQIIGLVKWLSS
jgi:hypothetical protein